MAGYYFEVLETIEDPCATYEGIAGEYLAARELAIDKYLVVVYKEVDDRDGFVITAFLTSKFKQLGRRAENMAAAEVDRVLELVPHLLDIPHKKVWVDYDEEADVLYVNFKKPEPEPADDSELTDDDVIIRYEKGSVVGMTFLHAKKNLAAKAL